MKTALNVPLLLRQLVDCLVLTTAYLLAQQTVAVFQHISHNPFNVVGWCISLTAWLIAGSYLHLYDDFRSRPFSYEFMAIVKTLLMHFCILTFVIFYFFKLFYSPRAFIGIYSAYIFVGMMFSKILIKKLFLRIRMKGYNMKNILIVGAGETAMHFHNTIASNDHYGYQCVGFVDNTPNQSINGKYLGPLSSLGHILENHEIDDVVLAIPESSREETESIIIASEKAAKRVKIIADCYQHCTATVSMSLFGHFPVITIHSSPLDHTGNQQFKRLFDICFTLCLLITFSWLFILIAILIKISSPGPAIYKQERWGLKNKKLTFYKFRTMKMNSECNSDGTFQPTLRNDPRVTRIGKFLRRTNLDELPQFFNVLKGDMSFVGPRPHVTPIHLELQKTVQHYMLRHLVKPGITGWAQVNGCRGESERLDRQQQRINMDIWYIENYSFWLDCQIIFQTIVNMIKGDKNAY
ncbi:undecaprenyl-phosphate glucose phosphotransferase [Chitinophaga qingshengii]|uniref:Undecaprenyl-phosphate glucose phosphotransferase n=1 Tax=Chitinophaga qingshengii TaxID=1569794 RepID=A0ABR7TG73_9BACT|nr:undecaprenyl-phosphate glucose phosphotransferase [Chitinophaga qingshengii]MBC9929417.1 undecaprenyl-phosphate glucose phosphotransferase [Chitinophaga qingshengii]